MGKKQSGRREHLYFLSACIIIILTLMCGSTNFYQRTCNEVRDGQTADR
jgi:hypothetical protein